MSEVQNSVFLAELMSTTTVNDTDILVIEDNENTKKITARDLKSGFITDEESPAAHRLYSSKKVTELIDDIKKTADIAIGKIQGIVDTLSDEMITQDELDTALNDMNVKKADNTRVDTLVTALEGKRDSSIPITSKDLSKGSDVDKIHMENLAQDVINSMTGTTPVTSTGAPTGGWNTEDLADNSISADKLKNNYRYRGTIKTGDMNRIVDDGIYVVSSEIAGLPKYDATDNSSKLVEVIRYGEDNKYIVQRVFDITYTEDAKPWYERKGLFSNIHILEFIEHYDIMSDTLITSEMLDAEFSNRGTISIGNVFELADGNYLCEKTVQNLPSEDIYIVDVNTYGTRKEFRAKSIMSTGAVSYEAYMYLDSTNLPVQTDWFNTTNTTKSKFDGKKVHLFGDSIVFGAGATSQLTDTIEAHLENDYGYSVTNHALLDATVGNYRDDILTESSLLTQITTASGLSTADYAIIFMGSEDFRQGVLMGAESYNDDITFMGALNKAIQLLLEINPKIKLLFVTPLFRGSITPNDGLNTDDNMINDRKLAEFADAINVIAKQSHIPCLDLFNESMINKYTKDVYLNNNGVYLSDTGYELISIKIHDGMCKFY